MVKVADREKRIQKYEIMLILPKGAEESNAKDDKYFGKKFVSTVQALGGKIEKEDFWGEKRFSYKIKKQESGVYVVFWFSMETQKEKELEQKLRYMPEVVRYLITRLEIRTKNK